MKKISCVLLASLGLLLNAASVSASLFERDLYSTDDALLTYDTSTGLEWLDVNFTVSRSYNEISVEFGAGGEFEGFRYASRTELLALLEITGISNTFGEYVDTGEAYRIFDFMRLFGYTSYNEVGNPVVTVRGIYDDAFAPSTHGYTSLGYDISNDYTSVMIGGDFFPIFFGNGTSADSMGHFLVRNAAPVPLPSAFLMSLSVVVPLIGSGVRRDSR